MFQWLKYQALRFVNIGVINLTIWLIKHNGMGAATAHIWEDGDGWHFAYTIACCPRHGTEFMRRALYRIDTAPDESPEKAASAPG